MQQLCRHRRRRKFIKIRKISEKCLANVFVVDFDINEMSIKSLYKSFCAREPDVVTYIALHYITCAFTRSLVGAIRNLFRRPLPAARVCKVKK